MNTFKRRSLTGILFVLIVAGALWLGQISFFFLFALIITGGLWEFFVITTKTHSSLVKVLTIGMGLTVFTFTFLHASGRLASSWLPLLFLGFFLLAIVNLFQKTKFPKDTFLLTSGILYIAGSLSTANYIVFSKASLVNLPYQFEMILSIFIIIWLNDTMAYIGGKWTGKHKLAPTISPKKTWEGTLTGFIFAALTSLVLSELLFDLGIIHALLLGGLISAAATTGDLLESALKRDAGVKDSGSLLPGHGGILDRFDAALFAIPVAFFYL